MSGHFGDYLCFLEKGSTGEPTDPHYGTYTWVSGEMYCKDGGNHIIVLIECAGIFHWYCDHVGNPCNIGCFWRDDDEWAWIQPGPCEDWSSSSSSSTYIEKSSSSSTSSSTSSRSQSTSSGYECEGVLTSVYPTLDASHVLASTSTGATFLPYFTCDPDRSLTGVWDNRQWLAAYDAVTNQKFNIDLSSAYIIKRIYYENGHNAGDGSDSGVQSAILYGTNNDTAGVDTDYSHTTNLTQIWSGTFDKHSASDATDPKYISVKNYTAFRYYIFRFANNYGNEHYLGIRRIELQECLDISSSSSSSTSSSSYSHSSHSSSSSSSSSGVYEFVFDRYLTINETSEMGKDHFIKLYTGKTTGKTKSNKTFYGDTGVGDMVFVHYVELKINNIIYYTPVYTGAPTVACCSTLTGAIES